MADKEESHLHHHYIFWNVVCHVFENKNQHNGGPPSCSNSTARLKPGSLKPRWPPSHPPPHQLLPPTALTPSAPGWTAVSPGGDPLPTRLAMADVPIAPHLRGQWARRGCRRRSASCGHGSAEWEGPRAPAKISAAGEKKRRRFGLFGIAPSTDGLMGTLDCFDHGQVHCFCPSGWTPPPGDGVQR